MDVQGFENNRWDTKKQNFEFRHRAALDLTQGSSVLDVGCGDGLLLHALREKGMTVAGIDLSDVAVGQCRAQGLEVVQGDFAAQPLPFADHSFDTVIALDVLEHVYDPAFLLQEMVRVSSSEVIIGVPNFSSLPARLQTLFGRVPENNHPHKGHIYWFNWDVLSALVAAAGLSTTAVRVNVPWERVPLLGTVMRLLARVRPNIFALSFVARYKRV